MHKEVTKYTANDDKYEAIYFCVGILATFSTLAFPKSIILSMKTWENVPVMNLHLVPCFGRRQNVVKYKLKYL